MRSTRLVVAAMVAALAAPLVGGGVSAAEDLPVAGVTASADDGNVAANTLDGDLATRWSAEGDGVWIRYDLGAAVTVGSLAIAWHNGDQRRTTFEVQTSADAQAWTTVVNRRASSGTTREPETYDFIDRTARYLRIVGHGNTVNDWTSVTEVSVSGLGDPPGGDCEHPADVLDLTGWKVQLPVGADEDPDEVTQPDLATYWSTPGSARPMRVTASSSGQR